MQHVTGDARGPGAEWIRRMSPPENEIPVALPTPPDVLFHGTPERNVEAILREGLRAGNRHAVHLSPDVATARKVGERRGPAVVLRVEAGRLAATGALFTRSANGVWLADSVPSEFLSVADGESFTRKCQVTPAIRR